MLMVGNDIIPLENTEQSAHYKKRLTGEGSSKTHCDVAI